MKKEKAQVNCGQRCLSWGEEKGFFFSPTLLPQESEMLEQTAGHELLNLSSVSSGGVQKKRGCGTLGHGLSGTVVLG